MKKLVVILLIVLAFWLGTKVSEARTADNVVIHIRTAGPIGVPFEWWSDDGGGGNVWLGTGPDFRVFLNGEERFPLPCPVPGGCRPESSEQEDEHVSLPNR